MKKNVDTLYHLTPLQHGMLHHSQLDRESGVYVEQFSCVLVGSLDRERFQRAWEAVVQRHDVLKTLFMRLHEEKPLQVVCRQVVLPFQREDWSTLSAPEQAQRFDALLADDRRRGFDPSVAPLMRLQLCDLGAGRHRFLWTYHHAILDGWSMPVLLNEVFRFYAGAIKSLPATTADYRHYVAWLRKQDLAQAREFWVERLKGFRAPLQFATSVAPDPLPTATRRTLATASAAMASGWAEAAAALCRAQRITLNTLCQGVWSALLGLYGDSDDVVYGTVVSGRSPELNGAETMVGLFINTLPTRVKLEGTMEVMAWLRQLQSDTQQAERYAYSPLAEVLQCAELPRQQALFDSLYVFENYPGQDAFRAMVASSGLQVEDLRAVEETNYPLALIVLPVDGVRFALTYDTARFSAAAIERMLGQYRGLLERVLRHPDEQVQDLRLEPAPAAVAQAPALHPLRADSLAALLSGHATAAPQQIALASSAESLDYGTLAQHIQHAVRHWAQLGYQPGDRVLLALDSDTASWVALLSGLAYGLDCVLPDHDVPLAALLAAEHTAWGRVAMAGCVVSPGLSADRRPATKGLRCDVFEPGDESSPRDEAAPQPDPARGACSLLGLGPHGEGDWTLLRYDHTQLLRAAEGFATRYPVSEARDIAFVHSPLRHAHLWAALMGLASGLTLRQVGGVDEQDFLRLVADEPRPWHSVHLSAAQTRRLGRAAGGVGTLRVAHWLADACGLTAADARCLQSMAPQAVLVRELRWPAHSLPHAAWQVDGVPLGAGIGVVDRNLRLAAVDARAQLVISGATVPTAWLHRGQADRRSWWMGPTGPQLLTDLQAWADTSAFCHAELPQAEAGLNTPHPHTRRVESGLAGHASVRELALIERLSARREWEHALYFSAVPGAATDELKDQLQAACAAQGLIDVVVAELAALPRTEQGLDRGALLRGEVVELRHDKQLAPRDELESALHEIWCSLLKRDRIGIDSSFFDVGGQSLLASVMLYQIEEKLSFTADMETLLELPTIAGLAQAIRRADAPGTRVKRNLAEDAVLAADIVPSGPHRTGPPRAIFLTGATGFLGAHLLAELLYTTQAQVFCLVRAADAEAGHKRLADALKAHGLWQATQASRIVAVPGELDQDLFGLSASRFDELARSVDVIYHNGAMVNFVYPYSSLKQVNVLATQDVLRLACLHTVKPVHYISTVGVLDRTLDSIPEVLAVPLHDNLIGGYEQSKWVAEQLVCLAAQRGLPVSIYRPSRIVGHSSTGRMNTDDLFCRLIKGIVLFGKAPYDTGFDNILPVDVVSRIIVEASFHPGVLGQAVHVINPQWHSMNLLVEAIEARGHAIERQDYNTWLSQLAAHVKQDPAHPLAMLIPVLSKLNPIADPSVGRQMPIVCQHIGLWAAGALADSLRPVDEWLRVYFDHFYSSGYLPQPVPVLLPSAIAG